MTDNTTRQVVQQLVLNEIAAGKMFTAYDITLQARDRGLQLRHGEGRELVQQMFGSGRMGGDYTRGVIDIGTDDNPTLYYRLGDDPNSYHSGETEVVAKTPPQESTSPPSETHSSKSGFLARFVQRFFGIGASATQRGSSAAASRRQDRKGPKRASVTLDLDASDFLPITREDLLASASRLNLWSNPWLGRRDIIPPVSDPRTKMIDRAMVTRGILTPKQLAEIHRVGAEMDHYRPTKTLIEAQARQAGADAIQADRARKKEEKERKRAEAKERREKRQAEIEHRRETDIVFLGRQVSSRLHLRESDSERLRTRQLPDLSTPGELANALGVTVSKLRWLAFHNDVATRTHYVEFSIPKKSGGVRRLSAPHQSLAGAQRWILDSILNRLPVENAAHGFVRGRSILTNSAPHVGKAVVLNMDLEDFFPSIRFPRVRHLFQTLGYSPATATILALLCTESPRRNVTYAGESYLVATGPRGLPQGACTSPSISNQIACRLDRRLQGLATKFNLVYTRYADDLTLSGDDELSSRVGYVMAKVRHIAEEEGFVINVKKTRVLRRNTAQMVTGLVVNDKQNIRRKDLRRIRSILHHARHEGLAKQNRNDHPNFRAWLEGMIAHISNTRPDLGRQFMAELNSVCD